MLVITMFVMIVSPTSGGCSWPYISAVPGLGSSVVHLYKSPSVLKLWEERTDQEENERVETCSLSKTIFNLLRLKGRKPKKQEEKKLVFPWNSSFISKYGGSLKRSKSAVTSSKKTKTDETRLNALM